MFPAQIRSITLDTWLEEHVAFLSLTGNAVANAVFESKLMTSGQPRPLKDEPLGLERFIRRKYADLEWAAMLDGKVAWPPLDRSAQESLQITSAVSKLDSEEAPSSSAGVHPVGFVLDSSTAGLADLQHLSDGSFAPVRFQTDVMDDDRYLPK